VANLRSTIGAVTSISIMQEHSSDAVRADLPSTETTGTAPAAAGVLVITNVALLC